MARFFGPAHMAMLFGVVMVSHQIGGFLGAWLGGKSVDLTGSYDWMWWADIVLAVGAALAHLPIDEKKKVAAGRRAAPGASPRGGGAGVARHIRRRRAGVGATRARFVARLGAGPAAASHTVVFSTDNRSDPWLDSNPMAPLVAAARCLL